MAASEAITWSNGIAVVVLYVISLAFYRLTFHPLAQFPGPWLAAVTRYYEGYYDLVQNGQYTFKIAEFHRKYGPIVRISPYELHVSDPAFFDTLYRQDAHFDKYWWSVDAFRVPGASGFTVGHDLHRARRQPLNSYFSKPKIAGRQDMIRYYLSKLHRRIAAYIDANASFDLGAATTALVRDATNHFLLGKSYGSLERDDFDIAMLVAGQGGGSIWRVSKFVRWVVPLLNALPDTWVVEMSQGAFKIWVTMLFKTKEDIRTIMEEGHTPSDQNSRTLVHEITESKLPPSEKTLSRVYDDISTVAAAGFETTASVLRLLFFHALGDADILHRLRAELAAAGVTIDQPLEWKTLEQLPYLTAILHEGTRLSPAMATRAQRISPKAGLIYNGWHIPAGTPVGMTVVLMHLDETLYREPQRFNPDRWLEAGVLRKTGKGFAPFGKGTRSCVGMHLAWALLYLVVADLALRYDFQFPEARTEDFEATSDQFAIGTTGKGVLMAKAKYYHA